AADHATESTDHPQDVFDAAVVEHVHFDSATDELGGDVGLKIREAEHEIRAQLENAIDFGTRECRDLRLFLASPRWAYGEPGNTDDAPVLTEQVKRFRRLLGETDDSLREAASHYRSAPVLRLMARAASMGAVSISRISLPMYCRWRAMPPRVFRMR